ncbi:sensor histidine kinase [Pseudomonadota bacterium]
MDFIRRYFSTLIFVVFLTLSGGGAWYVWGTLQRVETSIPLGTLAIQQHQSALIENLTRLASALNAVTVEPTQPLMDEFVLALDISYASYIDFHSALPEPHLPRLDSSMTEVERILTSLSQLQRAVTLIPEREGLVYHTRLTDLTSDLRNAYLRINETALMTLIRQVGQIEQLRTIMTWILMLILLAAAMVALFMHLQNKTIKQLLRTQRELQQANEKVNASQKELQKANERLQGLDKLKSMFIASMSHELRTPLNSIIGFSGLMMQDEQSPLNSEQQDGMERIHRGGKHLLSLISDVIDISKIEADRIELFVERFPLKEVVDEALETVQVQADAKGLVLEHRANVWPEMNTDRKRLLQCLLNYLSNAIKFTEAGKVSLAITADDRLVDIRVTDTGIGIAPDDLPKLFEAFERLESHLRIKAGGTGLGLYLTKKIAEGLLHGKVSIKSRVNEGSTFGLTIPIDIENHLESNDHDN